MSHFVVNVIVPKNVWDKHNDKNHVEEFIAKLLAPFDEQLETPRYVRYTKAQLIEKGKKEIDDYKNGYYNEYLKDPVAYSKGCSPEHIKYISKTFPQKLSYTDEEIYEDQIGYYEPEDIGVDGEVYSEYNPNSKWDWYVVGGRWAGWLQDKEKEMETDNGFNFNSDMSIEPNSLSIAEASLKNKIPFAVLTPTGEWIERGDMGWWGVVSNNTEQDEWDNSVQNIYKKYHEDYIVSVDCHI